MAFKKETFVRGIILRADDIGAESIEGELKVGLTSKKLHAYLDGALRNVVTENQSQTLTNKTIDVDNNTVSNIEVDNLKAGVLNTSTSMAGASDTQIPSALAIKTYVDNTAAAQNEASEISFAPVGNIVATNVQAMGAELDSDLSAEIARATAAEALVQSNLNAHMADPTDAHDASAISFVPTGDITSTEVQSAIVELGTILTGEIDGVAQDLADHIADPTDAHDGTAISIVPSGNLAATNAQAGLYELQGDIDTINTDIADDVEGPASATDDALARFDGTTGKLIQNSVATLSDAGALAGLTNLTVDNLNLDGSTITGGTSTIGIGTNIVKTTATDILNGRVAFVPTTISTSGANATITPGQNKTLKLTNASLTSIDLIDATVDGQEVILINATGNDVTINNNASAFGILTGTGASVTLKNEAAFSFSYNGTTQRWNLVGGSGSGGAQVPDVFVQLVADEQVSTWATGDNATFLGGGTLSGTFTRETSSPLNGTASYKYTQAAGSLNDYLASPVQSVPIRFRGNQATVSFPYLYDGSNDDITLVVYDVTNSTVLTNSAFNSLDATGNNTSICVANVFIPLTCTQIRVGFQTIALNSGKILQFDDIQISSDATKYADTIQSQSSHINQTASFGNAAITGALTSSDGSGIYSYNSSTGVYTVLRNANFTLTASMIASGAASILPSIVVGATTVAISTSLATANARATVAYAQKLLAGQTFVFSNGTANTTSSQLISVLAQATNENIVAQSETFSTDTALLTYAGSATYTLSTLANAPVGTFITFTYASSTNTRTQTTTAPTQTTSDMNTNGIQIFTRAFNAASTAAQPAAIAIQIGKGMKGKTLDLYKSTGRVTSGSIDSVIATSTTQYGCYYKEYNELTGILVVDAGVAAPASNTSHTFEFTDVTSQTNGYLVINASKNPALTGIGAATVAARGVNSAGTSISNTVEQVVVYDTAKTFDTHGALNTSTGVFTAPVSGYYQTNWNFWFSNQTYAVGNIVYSVLYKNGSAYSYGTESVADRAAGIVLTTNGSTLVYLTAGETASVALRNNRTAGATTLDAIAAENTFSIIKVSLG